MQHEVNVFISIITVCYNSEKTIGETLESLLRQTYKNYELILIDGASGDTTLDIVNMYKDRFRNITVISEPDKGIYNAMNKGIELCKGELVAFLNSDDYYEERTLEWVAKSYTLEVDVLHGDIYFVRKIKNSSYRIKSNDKAYEGLGKGKMISHPATFVKTKLIKEKKFDETYKITSDYKLLMQLYKEKRCFKYLPYVLTNMRDGGISSKYHTRHYRERVKCEKDVFGYRITSYRQILIEFWIKPFLKQVFKKIVQSERYMLARGWEKIQ